MSKNSQEGSVLLLVLVGILLLGAVSAGAYYFGKQSAGTKSPTTSDSAQTNSSSSQESSTETFVSTKYKFSLQYPSNWETYAYGQTPSKDADSTPRFFRPVGSDAAEISLEVGDNTDVNLESFSETIKGYTWESKKVENTTVGGVAAVKVSGYQKGQRNTAVVFIKENYTYHIQTLGNYADVLDQILSTFKLTI